MNALNTKENIVMHETIAMTPETKCVETIVAYAVSGLAADGLGNLSGRGVGRGAAFMILISGVLHTFTALTFLRHPAIKGLENGDEGGI